MFEKNFSYGIKKNLFSIADLSSQLEAGYGQLSQRPCHACSHLNTEVKQCWARTAHGWETVWKPTIGGICTPVQWTGTGTEREGPKTNTADGYLQRLKPRKT